MRATPLAAAVIASTSEVLLNCFEELLFPFLAFGSGSVFDGLGICLKVNRYMRSSQPSFRPFRSTATSTTRRHRLKTLTRASTTGWSKRVGGQLASCGPAEALSLIWVLAENGFSEDETEAMVQQLKQRGLVQFLIDYLKPGTDGSIPSLRKLLLSLGVIPVRLHTLEIDFRLTLASACSSATPVGV